MEIRTSSRRHDTTWGSEIAGTVVIKVTDYKSIAIRPRKLDRCQATGVALHSLLPISSPYFLGIMGYSLKALLVLTAGIAFTDSSVHGLPSSNYVLHETRSPTGTGHVDSHRQWKRGSRLDPHAIIPLRIGLAQSNIHLGYEKLMEVSDPSSEGFGKHLSQDEVHDLFAPTCETFDAVHSWLVESGVNASDIRQYVNKGWLAIDLPVSHVEDLFQTRSLCPNA